MQQPPQDPNQQFTPNQSHQGFAPDAAYAPVSTIGDEIGLEPQESIEDVVKKIEKRNKAFSLAISIGFTVLIGVILYFWAITAFQEEEIELVVAATQGEKDAQIEKKSFQQSVRQKPSRPSSKPSSAISANKASPISVPSIENIDTPDFGSSFGDGFGAGGFGDGIGGGIGVPGVMKGRCNSADRIARLRKAGGKASMDRQVLAALRWLKTQQQPDGNWGTKFPVAMTAFALLAYSGHCETVDSPEFGETVKKAIGYLVTVAEKGKGRMSTSGDRNLSYEHGIAVYSLAEAYSMNKNARKPFKRISPTLKKAVPVIIEGQTNGGGWLYSYGSNGTGDLSVSGWNVQALKAAQLTGLKFSGLETSMKKAIRYLKAAEDPKGTDGYWKYRVNDGQKGKLSLTGVGAVCARMLGAPSQLEDKALDLINSRFPKSFQPNAVYSWYYHSQAAFQKQGKHWKDFNKTYQEVMSKAQNKDGSWPASAGHGQVGQDGTIYSTTLCTLMLEVYYRYLPTVK
ncbi:MAG: prenyltransferase/squalene oxidase repeat-containing protein [Verrucomicrobiota bacterium]|nr:prenyltransferase/squalene oxidase repeat-containing protein [Verrucomicrobiota bacterium]